MRPERLFLSDIVQSADEIADLIQLSGSWAAFASSNASRRAVLQLLTQIGEAAARLPAEFRANNQSVDWRILVDFRNFAVHTYWAVNWKVVWDTALDDVPPVRLKVAEILAQLPAEPEQHE